MSAYVVDDDCINRILTYLINISTGNGHEWTLRPLEEQGFQIKRNAEEQKRLAEEMFKLNCKSVDERYGERQEEKDGFVDFKYKPGLKEMAFGISELVYEVTFFQALKSLACFLYQSCEGTCDNLPLYLALRDVQNRLCINYVNNRPEYESAKWG